MIIKRKLLSIFVLTVMALSFLMPCCFATTAKDEKTKTPVVQSELKSKNKKEKSESQNVLVKFFITMLWVAGSCGAIFLALLAYKKLSGASFVDPKHREIAKNLNSPETIDDAAKFFIEKF